MSVEGKVVMITGASRGIGAEASRVFAEAGAKVILLARSEDQIQAIASEIGEAALAIGCDVADWSAVETAVARGREAMGGLDILVNNAGVIDPIADIASSDPAAWGRAIDINLKGVYHGIRAVLPGMRETGGGTIITVSSGAAHHALEGWSHYCASKAGAAMLTEAMHLEEAAHGVRVMGLSPGTVATDMQHRIRESGVNPVSRLDWSEHIPPDWPARALLWMCGPAADGWLGQEVSLRDPQIRAEVGLA